MDILDTLVWLQSLNKLGLVNGDKSVRNMDDKDAQLEESSTTMETKKRKRNESMQDLMDKYKITPIRRGLNERKKK